MIISIEGADGTGKSSICRMLCARMQKGGIDALVLHEPGSTLLGDSIRGILLDFDKGVGLSVGAEFFLFCAARAQLIEEIVVKQMDKRDVIVFDRYIDSTIVYQGMAMGLGYERVLDVMRLFFGDFFPELTIVLDSSLENVLERIGMEDRIERRGASFIEKVLKGFRHLPELFPERVVLIDSNRPLEEVMEDVWKVVSARL